MGESLIGITVLTMILFIITGITAYIVFGDQSKS